MFSQLTFMSEPIPLTDNFSKQDEINFIQEALTKVKKMKVHFITQPPTFVVFNSFPENSISAPFGTYQVDLTPSEDILYKNFHKKHRQHINKAKRNSVEIKSGKFLLEDCSSVITETMERQGLAAVSKEYIKKLDNALGNQIEYYAAYSGGECQGGVIIAWNKNGAYALYGGSLKTPVVGSIKLMYWHILLSMKERGIKLFDFIGARIDPPGGSKYEGIQRFKEGFGATLKTGYLWKYPVHPLAYFVYTIALRLKSRLNGKRYAGDIIDQERKKTLSQ